MSTRFDVAWLQGLRDRMGRGEPWQEECRLFLTSVRELGRAVIGRTSRRTLRSGHEDDILAVADARFVSTGIQRYRGDASPQTYYATIVARTTVSYLRPSYRKEEAADPASLEDHASIESDARAFEFRHDLSVALTKLFALNASYAEAFFLYYMEQAGSDAECGATLGIDAEAFRKRRERGRGFLRKELGPPEGEP